MVDKQDSRDKDKDSSKDDDEEEDEDYSITTTTNKTKVPEINLFGAKVKLDTLTLVAAALGTVAAGGVGYILYNQYKTAEEQKKAFEMQERQKAQAAMMNQYMQRDQLQQLNKKRQVPMPTDDNLVDMDGLEPVEPIEQDKDLDKILAYGNPYRVPMPNVNTKIASKYVPVSPSNNSNNNEPVVDMDHYADQPEMQVIEPTVERPPQQQKRKREQEQQQEGPTEEELYAQMNTNNNFY